MSWMVLTRRAAERPRRRLRQAAYALFTVSLFRLSRSVFLRVTGKESSLLFSRLLRVYLPRILAERSGRASFFAPRLAKSARFFPCFSPDNREEQGDVPRSGTGSAVKNSAGRGRRQGEWETPGRAPGYGFAVEPSVGRKGSAGRGRPVSRPVSGTTQVDSAMTAAAQPDHIAFELKPNRNRASPSPSAAGTDRRACIPPRAPRARASS